MCNVKRLSLLLTVLLLATSALAQITGGVDVNTSQKNADDNECAIIKNPANKLQLFAACNTAGAGLYAARSTNGGATWTYPDAADKTIADGDAGQGPTACCDPTLAWDTFGNLFITYIDSGLTTIVTLLSTDGGLTFNNIANFASCVQCVDQPTVVAENTAMGGSPVAVWVVWNQGGSMVARGAPVNGLNMVGAFNALQNIPGTAGCTFGDIAIAPSGVVVQACQSPAGDEGPSTIFVNADPDGLGPMNFGAAVNATATNVGGFDFIPAQNARSVDSEAGLAYDRNPMSPHAGRLYLVYTDEVVNEGNDTDIMVRFSDNDGATWSAPIRVNDDPAMPVRSQFLPKIASNRDSGNIVVCWHDARNSMTNMAMQEFCSMATPAGMSPAFFPNVAISDGSSTSNGVGVEFGDYSGLAYFRGRFHPMWADTSNSTGNNPNANANFDAYTDIGSGGMMANEGDPHIVTVDGVHYDFQAAGEFVSLRDWGGTEIQTRQTAISTTFFPGANAYTGLATCVALNTAVAARVGTHRVTYQPNLSGVPDPSGLQLRVDGTLTTIPANGINLSGGGRITKTGVTGGIAVDFPDGTDLVVTPGWWSSQSKWYLNVDAYHTPALEGIAGAIARGSWLPALPDGTNVGPMPGPIDARYDALYKRFGDAWRVTEKTSLFDYAPGTSTKNFTIPDWPKKDPPCVVPEMKPVEPLDAETAEKACEGVQGRTRRDDCVFDVIVTGEVGFAKTYLLTQRVEGNATTTTISEDRDPTKPDQAVTFTATVTRRFSRGRPPTGTVQFFIDDKRAGEPVKLESGRAKFTTSTLKQGRYSVWAQYTPDTNSGLLPSTSEAETHRVR